MKSYGLEMDGEFVIETIDSKPPWTEAYIGRFIYAEDTDSYWLGGLTKWLQIGYGKDAVDEFSINFGFGYRQVNARSIPFNHNFIPGDNVFESISALASGQGLYDLCLEARHFKNGQIKASHISWSITDGFVNARYMPIESYFVDSTTPEVITVQEAVNQLELSSIKIARVTVQSTAWSYAPAENLYRATVVALPITAFPLIVQCYTDTGQILDVAKVELDGTTNRVHIWHDASIVMNVVMVG